MLSSKKLHERLYMHVHLSVLMWIKVRYNQNTLWCRICSLTILVKNYVSKVWKGKNHKAPIRFELMTERFVVNALNYCVKLVGNKIGKEKHYKILLELIVSIETTSQWRCPMPPLSVNSYHVSFANILNFFQLSSNQKQNKSFCIKPGHLQREYIYTHYFWNIGNLQAW